MKNYRLKKEAVPYFKKDLATKIATIEMWNQHQVDKFALEEVEEAYVSYGHKSGKNSKTLSGWNSKEGSHFEFTIHYPSVKFSEHDKFGNGKITRELMNSLQSQINNHYKQFVNGEEE